MNSENNYVRALSFTLVGRTLPDLARAVGSLELDIIWLASQQRRKIWLETMEQILLQIPQEQRQPVQQGCRRKAICFSVAMLLYMLALVVILETSPLLAGALAGRPILSIALGALPFSTLRQAQALQQQHPVNYAAMLVHTTMHAIWVTLLGTLVHGLHIHMLSMVVGAIVFAGCISGVLLQAAVHQTRGLMTISTFGSGYVGAAFCEVVVATYFNIPLNLVAEVLLLSACVIIYSAHAHDRLLHPCNPDISMLIHIEVDRALILATQIHVVLLNLCPLISTRGICCGCALCAVAGWLSWLLSEATTDKKQHVLEIHYQDIHCHLDSLPFGIDVVGRRGELARITHVRPGSTAERAGICVGDVLVDVDGCPVTGRNLHELRAHFPAPSSLLIRRFCETQ
eukprot:TRINITY_DN27231_c0_g2_i1.p1 TRINITY_DN27231_c0_g2~~TRINITY_DN27231_c0_g2_i1.p1  ORF type:complete len:399 (+),score=54.91 TRINITY_DN27231_c0_g2_i1:48-1244(+)